MKAYIVGGGADGTEEYAGVYHLVTADGDCWATQWCSSFAEAKRELYDKRELMQADMQKKHGPVPVLRLGEDEMTFAMLLERERTYDPAPIGQLADGLYYSVITVKDGVRTDSEPKSIRDLGHALMSAVYASGISSAEEVIQKLEK